MHSNTLNALYSPYTKYTKERNSLTAQCIIFINIIPGLSRRELPSTASDLASSFLGAGNAALTESFGYDDRTQNTSRALSSRFDVRKLVKAEVRPG